MIKAVIFDAYGTLISTGNGSIMACKNLLASIGVLINEKTFYKKWKAVHKKNIINLTNFKTEEEIFISDLFELYKFFNITGIPQKDVDFMLQTLGKRTAFEDAKTSISNLLKKYKIYIGSTTDTKPLLQDLKRNGLVIDKIFTSEILKVYKPQKEFYLKILKDIGLNFNEVVFIGDSIDDDINGPQSIGIRSILIDREKKYANSGLMTVSSLNEIEGIIKLL